MNQIIPEKSYFRIGEVCRILGVAPYVVRYWESEFKSVKPIRSKSDQRLYRRKDVETLVNIKKLLHEERFTIQGARRRLSERRQIDETEPEELSRRLLIIKNGLLKIKEMIG